MSKKYSKNFLRVPYGQTVHDKEEITAVVRVLKTSTQMGQNVASFEKKIAVLFNKKYGIMTNSGSSALFLAIESLGYKKNSEVITPILTFSTTIACLVKNNLIPSFVDVTKDTFCIDINQIEKKINRNTVAILAPDLLGNICEWDKIKKIARKYNLDILQDSADTLGATFKNKSSGYFTDLSITSFYGSHIINGAGNGGMLCTSNKKILEKSKLLRSWGRSSSLFKDSDSYNKRFDTFLDGIQYDSKFIFSEIGYQLEPSEISAAFALIQLKKLKKNLKLRKKFFNEHQNFFLSYNDIFQLPNENKYSNTGWLAYPLVVKPNANFTRTDLQLFLESKNIQTRVIFTGNILRQPGFKNIKCKGSVNDFKNADFIMKGGILIACHHGLNKKMMNHIHNSIRNFLS